MTLVCLDCGSDRIHDAPDPWLTHVPCCLHCSAPLWDIYGKPLDRRALRAYCWEWHRNSALTTTSYNRDNWLWRRRDLFDHRDLLPPAEAALVEETEAELAAKVRCEHRR